MTNEANNGILRVEDLIAGYGKKQVLNGVSLEVSLGEIVALIGHNGAGKSTLLKAVFGMIPICRGRFRSMVKWSSRPSRVRGCAWALPTCRKATAFSRT